MSTSVSPALSDDRHMSLERSSLTSASEDAVSVSACLGNVYSFSLVQLISLPIFPVVHLPIQDEFIYLFVCLIGVY